MNGVPTRSELSRARRRLLDLMSEIGFGRIEGLIIQSGEPVFCPAPRMIREVVFRNSDPDESRRRPGDYPLKRQAQELFAQIDLIRDGRIERLEIKHGLPFRMTVEERTGGHAA